MVTEATVKSMTFAHSPDPDDAYMFYGFEKGVSNVPGYKVEHHLEDIQGLNERAFKGEFEITAVSAHAYAYLSDKYWVLNCGASVGRGYGPMMVAKPGFKLESGRKVAVPGKWTTAALVLDLWLAEQNLKLEKVQVPFDQILDQVAQGKVDCGVIIHEGQLTYREQGLEEVWNSGKWWQASTGLPLPLGLDVVRVDLGMPLAKEVSKAFRDSIVYANAHQEDALAYAMRWGRGLDKALNKRFVGMYVNEDTLTQGEEVQKGLQTLYDRAFAKGLLPSKPNVQFI